MGLGFGDFAGQLTADELARALAAAGGRPDELQFGAPPAPAPVAPPVPAPPRDMGLQAPQGAPGRAIRELDAAQLSDANERIALAGQAGEQKAQSFEQRAGVRREEAMRARENVEGARADVAKRREHEDKYQAEADRIYEEMKQHTQPPPASVMSKVMNIVAMVAATQGNKGAAQGAAMLAGSFGQDPARWEAEQRANSNLYQNALRMVGSDREGASHDLDSAQRIMALESHESELALQQIAETSKSAEMRQAALDTQLELRMKTRAGMRSAQEAKLKAAGAGQRNAAEQYFWKLPFDQLRAMPSQVLGETGAKVLKERTGIEGGLKKLDGEDGAVQAGALTPTGRKVIDPSVYNQLSATEKNKLMEADDAAKSLATNIDELLKLRKKHSVAVGVPYTEAYDAAQAINSKIQLAMKKADTLGTLDKGSVEFLEQMTGNPNAWTSAPEHRLSAIKESTLNDIEVRAQRSGLSAPGAPAKTFQEGAGAGLAPGQLPALNPRAAETVKMTRPDGKTFEVHPTQVPRLRAAGWIEPSVAGGAFIAQPADLMAQGGGQ